MSLVLLKLASGVEVVGHEAPGGDLSTDARMLTSAFLVVAEPVAPGKIQIGLAPVSLAAADSSNVICIIAANQIIATLEPSELLCDAHRSATGKVAVARAPVIALR